jgi:hypothetical protein
MDLQKYNYLFNPITKLININIYMNINITMVLICLPLCIVILIIRPSLRHNKPKLPQFVTNVDNIYLNLNKYKSL